MSEKCISNGVEPKTEDRCIRVCPDVNQINTCMRMLEEHATAISQLAQMNNMLGNETRLKIMYIIYKEQQVCVCDLSDILNMTVPAVSQQLKKLRNAGLLVSKKVGQTIFYSINMNMMELLLPTFIQVTINRYSTQKS